MVIPYLYNAKVVSVTDGDTVVLDVDVGFRMTMRGAFRLYGMNAPETSTSEGQTAKAYLKGRLPMGAQIVAQTHRNCQEKYGRYLAKIFLNDVNLNEEMVAKGLAVKYLDNIKNF